MTGGYLGGDQPVDPQSDYYPDYLGPPPMQRPEPPPAVPAGYPAPPPYGYPPSGFYGSDQSPTFYAGYPQPGSVGSYRPSQVLTAAVLSYVNAGLLILASFLLLFGATLISSIDDSSSASDRSAVSTQLAVNGLVNLVAGGLLIAGGVVITNRHRAGRTLLTIGAVICLAAGVYWLTRGQNAPTVMGVLLFTVLPLISLAMVWNREVTEWLRAT